MATEAGKVLAVTGEFIAINSDGTQRVLSVGDKVYDGERVVADGGSSISIKTTNGDIISGGKDANITLTNSQDIETDDNEDSIDKEIDEL